MWVNLNKNCFIRSISGGFELYSFEDNFEVRINNQKYLNSLKSIVRGEKEVPVKNKEIKEFLNNLEQKGIISFTDRFSLSTVDQSNLRNLIDGITQKVMGENCSIIEEIYFANPKESNFSPALNFFTAGYMEETTKEKSWSFGVDKNKNVAEIKAIVEALERYTSGIIPFSETIKSSAEKLGDLAIDPNDIRLYRQKNKKVFPFSREQEYLWKEVIVLPDNKKAYLPIECIYYPINESVAPKPCMLANSSGVASSFSFNEALLGAIYEYVERDAFMMTWLNRAVMPRINKNLLPEEIKVRIKKIENIGYDVHFINITIDVAPVILVTIIDYSNDPSLMIGASSNLNILKACSKSLLEAEQQLYWAVRKDRPEYPIPKKQSEVKSVIDHGLFYRPPSRLKKASFLWSGEFQKEINQNLIYKNELKEIIKRIDSLGMKVVVADMSRQSLPYGIYTVRAIIPGLIPVYFGYGNEPFEMKRLEMIGNGWKNKKSYIHPFA